MHACLLPASRPEGNPTMGALRLYLWDSRAQGRHRCAAARCLLGIGLGWPARRVPRVRSYAPRCILFDCRLSIPVA